MAWFWLMHDAGLMSASHGDMPMDMAMPGMPDGPAPATFAAWGNAFVMWLVMMVAMMLPSASPMILLYAAFTRSANARGAAMAPTLLFASIYLLLWAIFSAAAAAAQIVLIQLGLVSDATLRLGNAHAGGILLVLAGLYQLTPIKRACLEQCRSPLSFVTRLWRPGWAGAARLGLAHGAYCIGCCWLLMTLLFVGGVMSLPWVAVLAVIVLIEKVAPIGERGARAVGFLAIAAGLFMLVRA